MREWDNMKIFWVCSIIIAAWLTSLVMRKVSSFPLVILKQKKEKSVASSEGRTPDKDGNDLSYDV